MTRRSGCCAGRAPTNTHAATVKFRVGRGRGKKKRKKWRTRPHKYLTTKAAARTRILYRPRCFSLASTKKRSRNTFRRLPLSKPLLKGNTEIVLFGYGNVRFLMRSSCVYLGSRRFNYFQSLFLFSLSTEERGKGEREKLEIY